MSYLRTLQLRRHMSVDGTGGGAPTEPKQEGATVATDGAPPDEGSPAEPKEPTFTKADLDAAIARTLAKERKKAEELVQAARTEGERLAKMSAEERARTETEQAATALKTREETLAQREAEITKRELRAQALVTLGEKGVPPGLADVLNYADAEACSASIAAVEKAFRDAVKVGVDERLRPQTAPKAGDKATDASVSAIFGNTKK